MFSIKVIVNNPPLPYLGPASIVSLGLPLPRLLLFLVITMLYNAFLLIMRPKNDVIIVAHNVLFSLALSGKSLLDSLCVKGIRILCLKSHISRVVVLLSAFSLVPPQMAYRLQPTHTKHVFLRLLSLAVPSVFPV